MICIYCGASIDRVTLTSIFLEKDLLCYKCRELLKVNKRIITIQTKAVSNLQVVKSYNTGDVSENGVYSDTIGNEKINYKNVSDSVYDNNGRLLSFDKQLEKINEIPNDKHLVISKESPNLTFSGLESNPVTISRGTINWLLNGYHKLTIDQVKDLAKEILDPSLVVDSRDSKGKDSKAVFTNIKSNVMDEYFVAYVRNSKDGANVVLSSYTRKDLQKYFNQLKNQHKETGGYFYINKKTNEYLDRHGLQLPQQAKIIGKNNLQRNSVIVNYGNEEKREQNHNLFLVNSIAKHTLDSPTKIYNGNEYVTKYDNAAIHDLAVTLDNKQHLLLNNNEILMSLEVETFYDYDGLFKSLLIQYKECFDEALKDVFLYMLKDYIRYKYHGYKMILMPSSEYKLVMRGFNHLELIFRPVGLDIVWGLKMKEDLIQEGKDLRGRQMMLDNFIYEGPDLDKVLIVDDVLTSGSSLLGAYKALYGRCRKIRAISLAHKKKTLSF